MSIVPYPQQGVAVTCRSFDEYVKMFNLTHDVLKRGPILDIAAGASSFTAEANRAGYEANAVDPQYAKPPRELYETGEHEIEISTRKLSAVQDQYDWSYYGSMEAHRARRERSLRTFAEHYAADREGENRIYHEGAFPHLPVPDNRYSLVLCSHFLFLYQEQFDASFHRQAIAEMLRACKPGGQVRVYPVMTLQYVPYPELDTVLEEAAASGIHVDFEPSRLPFIPGSTRVLVLTK